jgi:hypothetical protein
LLEDRWEERIVMISASRDFNVSMDLPPQLFEDIEATLLLCILEQIIYLFEMVSVQHANPYIIIQALWVKLICRYTGLSN